MSSGKPEENKNLLAKVARLVRNPGTGWAELDSPAAGSESGYSKQMLKEMIERKRRNDFVRKREFDMLRKLRQNEVLAGHDPAARPSFFQSSLASRPDDRAGTLKKIDEIEAQMSQQWWKSRDGNLSVLNPMTTLSDPMPLGPTTGGSLPGALRGELPPSRQGSIDIGDADAAPMLNFDFSFQPDPAPAHTAPPGSAAAARAARPAPPPPPPPPQAFSHDLEFEDPAIRFATGDFEGAEQALQALVAHGGARQDHAETWMALFDFYRAVGRQQQFDEVAMDFAARFARSAPQWVSFRDAGQTDSQRADPGGPQANMLWTSPAALGAQSLALLQPLLARSPAPWRLSWTRLCAIEDAALEPLHRLLADWCRQPRELHFMDVAALEQVLRQRTVSGDRAVNPAWWRLRMEALRMLHRPDEFEIVALDYCVTYEVSPPSWETPRSQVRQILPDGSTEDAAEDHAAGGSPVSPLPDGPSIDLPGGIAQAELRGELLGDALPALRTLEDRLGAAEQVEISCEWLVRMDFTASGTLLNWVALQQAEGRQVHFTDVHRLIAAFFGVVGIGSGGARISLRRD